MPTRIAWMVCVGDGSPKKIDEGRMNISMKLAQIKSCFCPETSSVSLCCTQLTKNNLLVEELWHKIFENSVSSTTLHRYLMAEMEKHPRAP